MANIHPSRQAYVEEAEPEVRTKAPPLLPTIGSFSSSLEAQRMGQRNEATKTDGDDRNYRTQTWASPTSNSVSDTVTTKKVACFSHITADDHDYELPTANGEKASAVLAQFARKRFANSIAVPTDDKKVRLRLRELGEPITLFGEGYIDRRDRLRELLTRQAETGDVVDVQMGDAEEEGDKEVDEEYYTEGIPELLEARKAVAKFSIPRSQARIAYQKAETTIPVRTHVKFRKALKERLQGFELFGSQIASDRPVSTVRFSPSGERIAVGTWSGTVKILDVPNLEDKILLRGHTDVVSGVSWMPGATMPGSNVSPSTVNLATGGGEGTINLWSLEKDTPLSTLSGHDGRVSRVDIHPSSRFLASASHDMTWRLWDIETSTELLLQEGHSREVHTVSFNTDGSLIASAGLDSVGRIWDVRTGRMVMFLDSHIQPIYALDWGTDGYRVLSGSADGFIKCWDVRAVKESATIGAHIGGVTDLKWFKGIDGHTHVPEPAKDEKGDYVPKKSGTFFVSTGFDREVKIFSADDWALTKTLKAHSGNVTGVDVTNDSKWIASCGRDRTVKLWARDDMEAI